ncbi:helix-turn-helix domain-containing protein [Kineosporia succinea]|uniref:AraC-like DNA-binding protein n=1 Tax=Kineosporia succinea TaxID=84632 RepID=A0ABT9P4S0_9ACTN|nr:helix-turn-helix domain-containing protein [Kineosporia succinea]MDP9827682.1 AraC-like DNA-binding protein [Kineosporia succinea]
MTYAERPAARDGVVLWRSVSEAAQPSLILPDGCLDLLWDGSRLIVAGPDTVARTHVPGALPEDAPVAPSAPVPLGATRFTALRFGAATGPAALGVAASDVVDRLVPLEDLWGTRRTRELAERVAAAETRTRGGAAHALESWLRSAPEPADPLGRRVFGMARAGVPVAEMADRAGFSARQLQRRSQELFGYGAGHLLRVLRLQRALARARAGVPLARAAADAGYCDQAHLSRETKSLTGTTPRTLLS